ncbi:DUF1120 domain-containing protein [Pseudomonas marginalis]|uniref:DUF1120 domain-containing protein n=1 Tax=Pseudomonas marginalis TaxID=298 RepID=UPI003BA1CF8D
MKQAFFISTLALAISSSAFASLPTIENGEKGKAEAKLGLTVKINAPVCTFDLNGGQTVDFGLTSPNRLSETTSTRLTQHAATLDVMCPAPVLITMSLQDTHMNALTNASQNALFPGRELAQQFALVDKKNPDALIGSYVMVMTDINNNESSKTHYDMHDVETNAYWDHYFRSSKSNSDRSVATAKFTSVDGAVQHIKNLRLEFNVIPEILPSSKISVGEGAPIDFVGETTFKMVYM